jgi:hypothetical protein
MIKPKNFDVTNRGVNPDMSNINKKNAENLRARGRPKRNLNSTTGQVDAENLRRINAKKLKSGGKSHRRIDSTLITDDEMKNVFEDLIKLKSRHKINVWNNKAVSKSVKAWYDPNKIKTKVFNFGDNIQTTFMGIFSTQNKIGSSEYLESVENKIDKLFKDKYKPSDSGHYKEVDLRAFKVKLSEKLVIFNNVEDLLTSAQKKTFYLGIIQNYKPYAKARKKAQKKLRNAINNNEGRRQTTINPLIQSQWGGERFTNTYSHHHLFTKKQLRFTSTFLTLYLTFSILSDPEDIEEFTESNIEFNSAPAPAPTPSPESLSELSNSEDTEKYIDSDIVILVYENRIQQIILTFISEGKLDEFRIKQLESMIYGILSSAPDEIYDELLAKFFVPRNVYQMTEEQLFMVAEVDNLTNKIKPDKINRIDNIILSKEFYNLLDDEDKEIFMSLPEDKRAELVADWLVENLEISEDKVKKLETEKTFLQKYLIIIVMVVLILLLIGGYFMFGGKSSSGDMDLGF